MLFIYIVEGNIFDKICVNTLATLYTWKDICFLDGCFALRLFTQNKEIQFNENKINPSYGYF